MTDKTHCLSVNGKDFDVDLPADATLLEALRDRLGLIGTRFGCGQEGCGACTVLVDGEPAFSCTLPAADVSGRRIETIEGIPPDDPLLLAFVENQAAQCAFCLPGIVMSSRALLNRNPGPTRSEVLEALSPHLCRCGAHQRIVSAVLSVGQS